MPFDWGWYGDVLYGINSIFLNHDTKLSSQNSGVFSLTMVLGTPFLANIILNICLTIVAFLSLTFIIFGHPKKESTKIKNKTMLEICAWSIWTPVHSAPSFGHLCIFLCLNVLIFLHLGIFLCVLQYLYNTPATKTVISIFFASQRLCHEYCRVRFNYVLP